MVRVPVLMASAANLSNQQPMNCRHIVEATEGIGNHGDTQHTVGMKAHFLVDTAFAL